MSSEPAGGEDRPARVERDAPIAIEVERLSKRYEIYDRPYQRLLQTVLRGRRTFYREFWALSDVSLKVRRGETVGLVGRNGSGKSTLLQLVAGTLTPTSGSVRTTGRVAALLELGSGFNPEFTGRENAFLNGAILGVPRKEMQAAMPAIEAFAGIGDFIDQPVKTYSSGMVVRLAFAVAVHVTPDVLIVDEALAVGDTAFQSKCLARIREMQRSGVAILLVSHSPNTVIEFCDRAAYLERGRLVNVGPCREVLAQYANDVVESERTEPVRVQADVPASGPRRSASHVPASEILGVEIVDAGGASKQTFAYREALRIRVHVAFARDNPAPCCGIQIKSTDDIILWTATTQLLEARVPAMRAGTQATFEWKLRANVGGARYVVAIGVGDVTTGEYRRHSRLHYAAHFDVLPEPQGGSGWLELDASFRCETRDDERPAGIVRRGADVA